MSKKEAIPPTVLVIFGISGDLAQRYLLPALAAIEKNNQLPEDFILIGVSRKKLSPKDVLGKKFSSLEKFSQMLQMNLSDQDDYLELKFKLKEMDRGSSLKSNIIFYFAVPPAAVLPIIRHLGGAGLNYSDIKLLLEKPFGVDLASAKELISETNKHFDENQLFRIDHYLAKEMAQNIAVFLGGNVLFRNIWSNKFIGGLEIIASERIDIEGRASFYEQSGALRDVVQSHLLQLAALTLMKPCPDVFDFSELPQRRLAALQMLKLNGKQIRAQYEGYRQEVNNENTEIETFAALQLTSNDTVWKDVPIKLITGKALDRKYTEIRVYFKKNQNSQANLLTIRIHPREGIELDLWVKKPGYDQDLAKLPLDFNYEQYFGSNLPEAYEQVIIDAIRGSQNLFASSAEVVASWTILESLQQKWEMSSKDLKYYPKGSNLETVIKQP